MRLSEMKQKEVINIKDCSRLGFVGDVDIDICTGRVTALIIPGPGCLWGFLGRESEYVIPWRDVKQIGDDIILVELCIFHKSSADPLPYGLRLCGTVICYF